MSNSMEQVISFEVNDDDIILFSSNGVSGIYPARLFLCEIYEGLSDCFERDIPCDEFFNYEYPRGAWELLSDFFDKTDYLQYATLKDFEEYRARYNISLDYKKGEMSTIYEKERSVSSLAALKRYSKELDKWRIFDKATCLQPKKARRTAASFIVLAILHIAVMKIKPARRLLRL